MTARHKLVTTLTLVAVVLGFLLALQYRQHQSSLASGIISVTSNDPQERKLQSELNALKASNAAIQARLSRASAALTGYEVKSAGSSAATRRLEKRLEAERILSGITPVTGMGVAVTLMDGQGANTEQVLTHDWDIRQVINEFFTAGSEAVTINGYRVVATSGIYCTGPVVRINNHRIAAPFLIEAIGDPQALSSALTIQGGILDLLRARGVNASTPQTKQSITMPAFTG
jgi:uncharacterized protein YlxW (UPF0749 family)